MSGKAMRRLSLADCISQDRHKNNQKENDYATQDKKKLACTHQQVRLPENLPAGGPLTHLLIRGR
jgi:hypothetical protein